MCVTEMESDCKEQRIWRVEEMFNQTEKVVWSWLAGSLGRERGPERWKVDVFCTHL